MRLVDAFDRQPDPQPFQRAAIDGHDRAGLLDQPVLLQKHGQFQRLARRVAPHAVLHGPARLVQQRGGLADVLAVARGAVADGQGVAVERAGQQFAAEGFEQRGHGRGGGAFLHRQHRAREIRGDARLTAAGERVVDELEIECLDQRLAHAPVVQRRAARVHHEAGDARRFLMRDFRQHDVAALHRGEVVLRGPFLGVEFAHVGDGPGLEGLFHDRVVAVELDADFVEIGHAAAHRQVVAPIVGIAGEGDKSVDLVIGDHVGRGAEGDVLDGAFGKIPALPLGLLNDRAQPGEQGQVAFVGVESETHAARAGGLDAPDLVPEAAIAQVTDAPDGLEGKDHVLDRHRAAVGKPCLGAQGKLDPFAVRTRLD